MNRYPEYSNSDISWLGKIPKHWKVKRLKYVARANQEALSESTPNDYEFNYVDIGNVGLEEGIKLGERINFAKAPSRARRVVRQGDTIVSTVRTYLKAVAHIDFEPKDIVCSTGFAVISPGAVLVPKFLYYILRSEKIIDRVEALSVGVSYPAINASELMGIAAWYPPSLDEQKTIADYLDRRTRQIDNLISKKEKMVELLKEELAATINRSVTRGLDLKVEVRNSGGLCLGNIPRHWKLKKLKYLAALKNQAAEESSSAKLCVDLENIEGWTGKIIEAGQAQKVEGAKCFLANDVLFAKLRPYLAKAYRATDPGVCGGEFLVLRPSALINSDFLFFNLVSERFIDVVNGATYGTKMPRASWDFIGNLRIPYPDKGEQAKIVKYLKSVFEKTDSALKRLLSGIAYLKEYRATLISDAVTGKIDVRGI